VQSPLATKYGAPILLTRSDSLSSELEAEIDRLKVKEIFIIGGTGVISQQVEDSLSAKGIECTRLWGNTRYDTSVAVANYLCKSSCVFVVTGENFPDALSVASYAAFKQMPILLTEQGKLPDSAKKYISDNNIKNAYIIGGYSTVSQNIENNFSWVRRIEGQNRYETNINH
jgi:putative cell wall-binding protein